MDESSKEQGDDNDDDNGGEKLRFTPSTLALLEIAKRSNLIDFVSMKADNLPFVEQTIHTLLDAIDALSYFDDAIFEQYAIYSLELALQALLSKPDRAIKLFDLFLDKFVSLMDKSSSSSSQEEGEEEEGNNIQEEEKAFLRERVCVTILRLCIHLFHIPQLRPKLMTSLNLLMDLPANVLRYIADRIACGMAIFFSQNFVFIETSKEWSFFGDMMDRLAFFGPGRGFVFDGIANTVESQQSLMSYCTTDDDDNYNTYYTGDTDQRKPLSLEGSHIITKLLLKFIFGKYQKDMSFCIPAMICMDNLYRHIIMLRRMIKTTTTTTTTTEVNDAKSKNDEDDKNLSQSSNSSDDSTFQELWKNIVIAFYSVCRNSDPEKTDRATDCFQRLVSSTEVESISDETWLTILHLVVMKQPTVQTEVARLNCCEIFIKILLATVAHLSRNHENWEDLTDIINRMTLIIGENLREGRKGAVSPLFESTRQSITFLSNYMISEDFKGNKEYGAWTSESLLSELEKVGAGGGSSKNMAATTAKT
mmetsp:Transcript_12572/g.14372  ORF Transcript_12572/g.14372 Transcript_12572/m.14372 type:complete len:534 (-) Transcript_12572:161-1762(-)